MDRFREAHIYLGVSLALAALIGVVEGTSGFAKSDVPYAIALFFALNLSPLGSFQGLDDQLFHPEPVSLVYMALLSVHIAALYRFENDYTEWKRYGYDTARILFGPLAVFLNHLREGEK